MRRRGRQGQLGSIAVAVVLFIAIGGPAWGSPLREAVDARTKGIASGAASQDRIDELSDQTDELANEYRDIREQTDALRIYNSQLQGLLDSQERETVALQKQIDRVAQVSRQMAPLMLRMIDALEEFIRLDVPFLLEERRARVANLRSLMDRADVTSSEKYRRILEAYQVENEYGRTIEAYQGPLEGGGEARTVDFLRVGRIGLLYRTLDGEEAGVWDSNATQWKELPRSYHFSLDRGLRMARKHAAPDLITLPVPAAEVAQ